MKLHGMKSHGMKKLHGMKLHGMKLYGMKLHRTLGGGGWNLWCNDPPHRFLCGMLTDGLSQAGDNADLMRVAAALPVGLSPTAHW